MFKNIGKKIMCLATIICWAGIILTLSAGIFFIFWGINLGNSVGNVTIIRGIGFVILGPVSSWISSFVLYGFGRLVENSDIIARRY